MDAEGSRTFLARYLKVAEWRAQGRSPEEIKRLVAIEVSPIRRIQLSTAVILRVGVVIGDSLAAQVMVGAQGSRRAHIPDRSRCTREGS